MPAHDTMKMVVAIGGFALFAGPQAHAAGDPTGVWLNDTGRGAIEIKQCGAALCGHVVWVKDKNDTKGCGRQIIGNAAQVAAGTWDNGWIYSPEQKQKFDVELKPLPNGTLQVTGYAGTKLFSKTMIWKPAPADLVRCGTQETLAKADPAAKARPATKSATNAKPELKTKPENKPAAKTAAAAKSEPKIIPPAPKPAVRPSDKREVEPAQPSEAPVEVARAEPQPETNTPAEPAADVPETKPDTSPPQVHALPGVADKDAPEVAAPHEDETTEPPRKLDMGKIAKKLAQLERDTGYGLKKTGNGNCRLKVPYATVNFPCKD